MFANLSAVMGHIKGGTLRALAVTSAQRSPSVPDVPTVAEAALPGFQSETWFGIVAPAGDAARHPRQTQQRGAAGDGAGRHQAALRRTRHDDRQQ